MSRKSSGLSYFYRHGTFDHYPGVVVSCHIVVDAGLHQQVPRHSKSYQEPSRKIQAVPRRKTYHHPDQKPPHKNKTHQVNAGIRSAEFLILRGLHVHHLQRLDRCKLHCFWYQHQLLYHFIGNITCRDHAEHAGT